MTDTFENDDLRLSYPGAQSIVDVATRAAEPQSLDLGDGRFYSIVSPSGEIRLIDLEAERRKVEDLDGPRHKRGTYRVHDADSFVTYLNKHGDDHTEIWADNPAAKITAVLNAHQGLLGDTAADGTRPRFEDHRVEYSVLLTDAWKAWTKHDGNLISQSDFAEHIEDRAIDIIEPSGADMLELAQTFQATIGVDFKSSKLLSSGERQLEYVETVDAKAGKAGLMEIPKEFRLGLRPFEGAEIFGVTARLRYRIEGGTLRIGYSLERPADVLREAFLGVVGQIQGQVEHLPVLRGSI